MTRPTIPFASLAVLAATLLLTPGPARAQCHPLWLTSDPLNGPRQGHAAVYDSDRGRQVVFGGAGPGGVLLGDTIEREGGPWMLASSTGPAPRTGHAMAYDSARRQTVLFGGFAAALLADTWTWDGVQWTRHEVPGPSPRRYHAMAYDAARQRVVLFGGEAGDIRYDDTWEWDGSAWARIEVAGPISQAGHAMAYDAERQYIVMYGMDDTGKTWTWNGSVWMQVGPTGGVALGCRMAYLEHDRLVIRYGGRTESGTLSVGAATWNGSVWKTIQAADEPARRTGHAMTYDPATRSVLVIGGEVQGLPATDVKGFWFFGPLQFTQHPASIVVPPGRTAEFLVAAESPSALTYQWYRFATRLRDGPRISGATTPHLMISGVQAADAGAYNCLVTASCGADYSLPGTLTVRCTADFTGDGLLDFSDYLEFLGLYDAQDPRADLGGDGLVDFADYLEFLSLYDAGC